MTDFTNKPYSEWIEQTITQLFKMEPECIVISAGFTDGTYGTAYYNCDNANRIDAIRAIVADCAVEWICMNADLINNLLNRENGDEDYENGDSED